MICIYQILVKYCCTNSIMITLKLNVVLTQDLFTDTDSLMHEMKSKDIYEDFSKHEEILGISLLSQNIMIIQAN